MKRVLDQRVSGNQMLSSDLQHRESDSEFALKIGRVGRIAQIGVVIRIVAPFLDSE